MFAERCVINGIEDLYAAIAHLRAIDATQPFTLVFPNRGEIEELFKEAPPADFKYFLKANDVRILYKEGRGLRVFPSGEPVEHGAPTLH